MKLLKEALLTCVLSTVALAQNGFHDNTERQLRCEDYQGNRSSFHTCDVHEQTVSSTGSLRVDAGENGGVAVKGWNQSGVLVRSKVETWGDSESDARGLMSAIQVHAAPGSVTAMGPTADGHRGWSVSYEVFVPHETNLDLQAHNGGVHVEDIGGTMTLHTVNGGLHLSRLTGAVTGVTVNGGVHVNLMGDHWDGRGLDATSTNGGVHVAVPSSYSAKIECTTVNGGIKSDFPELLDTEHAGRSRTQSISASIGHGGAPIHVATTNGGLTITRQ